MFPFNGFQFNVLKILPPPCKRYERILLLECGPVRRYNSIERSLKVSSGRITKFLVVKHAKDFKCILNNIIYIFLRKNKEGRRCKQKKERELLPNFTSTWHRTFGHPKATFYSMEGERSVLLSANASALSASPN